MPNYASFAQGDAAPAERAALLTRLGDLHRERGEVAAARDAYDAALGLAPSGGACLGRGLIALMSGEAEAQRYFLWARDALHAEGDAVGAATAEGNAAAVDFNAGRYAEAEAGFTQAITRLAQHGRVDPLLHCNLARTLARRGEIAAADAQFAHAAAQARPATAGVVALLWGEWLRDQGRADAAISTFERALSLLAGPNERLRALTALSGLYHARGDLGAAFTAIEATLPMLRAAGAPAELVGALVNLGGLAYLRKDPSTAAQRLDEALTLLSPELVGTALEARLRTNRGLALVACGRVEEARVDLARAAELSRAQQDWSNLATQLGALVDLHRYQGDLDTAITLQAEAITLARQHGAHPREGGMIYAAIEDRSLNISTAALRQSRTGQGRAGPVLLLCPPTHGATGPLFPRGAVAVASFLQAHGVPAQVLPLARDPYTPPAQARAQMEAAIRDAIDSLRPRAIGVSVTFSYVYPEGQAIAAIARAYAPSTPILIGGPHVTYWDQQCLAETPAIDVVVRGEGEWTALALLQALEAGADLGDVAGITYRAPDGSIRRNPSRPLGEVTALPPVDFGLLPAHFCRTMDISGLTSRGCVFRCKFCHEFRYWGGVVREHPVDYVLGEMARLAAFDNYLQGIDDSMLDMRTPYFHDLIDRLGKSPYVTPNFGLLTRLDTVTAAGARAMKDAGMRWLCVGAESGSQKVLDAMNKGLTVGQTRDGLALAREAGLETSSFLIIGHPGDNPAECDVTLSFVERLFADDLLCWLDLSTFAPYPGTPFFSAPARHGIEILSRDWSQWRRTNRPVAQLTDYSASEIYRDLLRALAIQDRHLRARSVHPPALGSGV